MRRKATSMMLILKHLTQDISKAVGKDMITYNTKVGSKVKEENKSIKDKDKKWLMVERIYAKNILANICDVLQYKPTINKTLYKVISK